MPIFKLTPTDNKSPDWALSIYRDPCLVEAADEKAARGRIAREFARREHGEDIADSPWLNRKLVACEETENVADRTLSEGWVLKRLGLP